MADLERLMQTYNRYKQADTEKGEAKLRLERFRNFVDTKPQPLRALLKIGWILTPSRWEPYDRSFKADSSHRSWERAFFKEISDFKGEYLLTGLYCHLSASGDSVVDVIVPPFLWQYDFPIGEEVYSIWNGTTGLFAKKSEKEEPTVEIRYMYQPLLHLPEGIKFPLTAYYRNYEEPNSRPQRLYAWWQPELIATPRHIGIPYDIAIPWSSSLKTASTFSDTEELIEIGFTRGTNRNPVVKRKKS